MVGTEDFAHLFDDVGDDYRPRDHSEAESFDLGEWNGAGRGDHQDAFRTHQQRQVTQYS